MIPIHSFPPLATADARLLILGSMPGTASLAAKQYYAHPRNLFWTLLAGVLDEPLSTLAYEERIARLLAHGIALWDVLAECERRGSLDAAIVGTSATINDFPRFFADHAAIRHVFCNGGLAQQIFQRRVLPTLGEHQLTVLRLPSSSPAHAALTPPEKLAIWRDNLRPALENAPDCF